MLIVGEMSLTKDMRVPCIDQQRNIITLIKNFIVWVSIVEINKGQGEICPKN